MAWTDNPYQVFNCSDYEKCPEGTPLPTRSPNEYASGYNLCGQEPIRLTKKQLEDLYATGELWIQNNTGAVRIVPTRCFRATFAFASATSKSMFNHRCVPRFERLGEAPVKNRCYGWKMIDTDFDDLLRSGDFKPVIDGFWTMRNINGNLRLVLLEPYSPTSKYSNQLHPIVL